MVLYCMTKDEKAYKALIMADLWETMWEKKGLRR